MLTQTLPTLTVAEAFPAFLSPHPPTLRRCWQDEEVRYLKASAGRIPYSQIATRLNRTVNAVRLYVRDHAIDPHQPPTTKQRLISLLCTSIERLTPAFYAAQVNCTVAYVYEICHLYLDETGLDLFERMDCPGMRRAAGTNNN